MTVVQTKASRSDQRLQTRMKTIIQRLKKTYSNAAAALHFSNPLELLIATILSAQCTDERVNMVTPVLFKKYKTAKDYAAANQKELEQDVRSTGFFRVKAKSIIACCKMLLEKYGGIIPNTMHELMTLQGVGRKTANVVLSNVYGIAEGIVVDTHVKRLAGRLGFSKQSIPENIERDLMRVVPKKNWIAIGNLLIWHGRRICQARKPKCPECAISDLCPSFDKYMKALYWA